MHKGLIGRLIHQLGQFAGIADAHFQEPAFSGCIFIDESRRGFEFLIDFHHFARHRRIDFACCFHAFDDSCLSALGDIRARLRLAPDCEITLEANPGTLEKDRFRAFRAAGVTRLSVGVQSFNDTHLQAVGRVHDRAQAIAACEEAADAFETFNLDLMYALPGQTLAQLDADLDQALALAPPHLSVYHLTLEPNTYFAKYPPVVPSDDEAFAMLDRITERTGAAGMARYEVSAYARAGHRCWLPSHRQYIF